MAKLAAKTNTLPTTLADIREFIVASPKLIPKELKIDDLRWKAVIRSVIRGENILFLGETGCGKTMLAQTMSKIFPDRPYFYFNIGATQDPRSTLIGNTHYEKDKGTFVAQALFVRAIQTPNALILLDELSRGHPEAHNILMTVLDAKQRYLRIDEDPTSPLVKVAEGVTFMATANVGTQYTATRTMDRALIDRFSIIKMEPLGLADETALLSEMYPDLDKKNIDAIAGIASTTREQIHVDGTKIDTIVSTRMSLNMGALINDGFSLEQALEIAIYPMFSDAGGQNSALHYMKQLAQKYLESPTTDKKKAPFPDKDNLNGDLERPWV